MNIGGLRESSGCRLLAVALSLLLIAVVQAQELPAGSYPTAERETGERPELESATVESTGGAAEAKIEGRMSGERAGSRFVWAALGFFFTFIGVGAALIAVPGPDAGMLLGKSPEYVAAYAHAYKSARRGAQFRNAAIGCAVGVAVAALVYILMVNTTWETVHECASCNEQVESCNESVANFVSCGEQGQGCLSEGASGCEDCTGSGSSCFSEGTTGCVDCLETPDDCGSSMSGCSSPDCSAPDCSGLESCSGMRVGGTSRLERAVASRFETLLALEGAEPGR